MPAVYSHRVVVSDRLPILRETVYDRIVAALWAIVLALAFLSAVLVSIWCCIAATASENDDAVIDLPISENVVDAEQATVTDVPAVEMPDQGSDPGAVQAKPSLLDVSDQLAAMTSSAVMESASSVSPSAGSPAGDELSDQHRSPIGMPRRQTHVRRWVIEVDAPRSLSGYAELLQQSGITPAAVYRDGRIASLNLTGERPAVEWRREQDVEDLFYTQWNQGDLQRLDRELFSAAGVDLSEAILLHFFSTEAEQMLQQQALDFAGRSAGEINRTWFRLAGASSGFGIEVVRQTRR